MVRQIARREGKRPVLMIHRRMKLCASLFPDAPIIRYIRDPRDVARSAIGMGWAGNVYHGAEFWMNTERSWQDFRKASADPQIFELRFEELVAEPTGKLTELCDFLGLNYDPAMLAYPETTTYDAPDAKLANQWKTRLTDNQIALVETRLGDLLEGSGYAASGVDRVTLSALQKLRLELQNRKFVWGDLIKRFGIVDPVLRGIGKRFGIESLRRSAAHRMNVKTRDMLK